MSEKKDSPGVSRRRFLTTTAAAAVTASLARRSKAQGYTTPTTNNGPWVRVSLTDPAAPAMLASYQTAITALLNLSPNDCRNFYRNAMIHTLDCPHGNWWFLLWHRGYIGWWEQTVRQLSGNPNFAFPYWDWTAQPYVPDAFWQGVLNPSNSAFISNWNDFQTQYQPAMTTFYAGLSAAQQTQLNDRGLPTVNDLFSAMSQGMFFPPSQARSLTQANPNFDAFTKQTVSLSTLQSALATPYFAGGGSSGNPPGGFGSDIVAQHSDSTSQGILESEPHNNVHNDVGGFMGNFLSPVDPIFMAHHSNIDRIWTLWSGTMPTGQDLTNLQNEPFLFYCNSQGQPVTQNTAGSYIPIGSFNYSYTKGSGATTSSSEAAPQTVRKVTGTLTATDLAFSKAAVAKVALPAGTASRASGAPSHVRAHITIQPPSDTKNIRFHVFVNPPDNELALDANHPSYAGTFEFFGRMHHAHPMTFTVPLDDALNDQRAAGTLRSDQLNIVIVPQSRGVALRAMPKASVTKVEVSTS